jgi:pyridoxamine 5'-phosphate oxidase family protein
MERGRLQRKDGFSEAEAEFLAENFIGRIATVSSAGQPHVVPVGFRFDGTSILFGGWRLAESLKFRNMVANPKVAFVVDEIISTSPWKVRGVEVRGTAEPERGGDTMVVKITPVKIRSWGMGKEQH